VKKCHIFTSVLEQFSKNMLNIKIAKKAKFAQSGHPGVDVMTTIFGEKNWRFSQKPML
jgi:hypothetical protein